MSQRDDYSEEALIKGLRSEDPKITSIVYKKNFPSIVHFIISNQGTEQEAKDIYQEAFIVFYEKLKDPHFVLSCQISTFIYSICRRLWLKRLSERNKYMGRIEEFDNFVPIDKIEQEAEEKEIQFNMMSEALEKLGEPCRSILKNFYLKKMSMQEICEKMGYTNADNAKNQKYKCLQRLKKIFFKEYQKNDS